MARSQMDGIFGMFFIFGDHGVRQHTFYMKNTRIPLDIMYFDKDSVLINIARNAQPGADSEAVGGMEPVAEQDFKLGLEFIAGWVENWGWVKGKKKFVGN